MELYDELLSPTSLELKVDDLKGLVEGVGLELFVGNGAGIFAPKAAAPGPAGENLDGTVPARSRLRAGFCPLLSGGGMKSGNPS